MRRANLTKKHEKTLRRQHRNAAKNRHPAELAGKHEFPRFVWEPNGSPEEFVEAVRLVVRDIDFRDRTAFRDWETFGYRRVRQVGWSAALLQEIGLRAERSGTLEHLALARFANNLGHQVFQRIAPATLLRFIPIHDVQFIPAGHHIRVYFRSLNQARGPGGTAYYSPHEPKLEVDGQKLIVAFSNHAIDRVCKRLSYTWPSYAARGDIFAFFYQCLDFEVCRLHPDNTLGFTFFVPCGPDISWHWQIAKVLMGQSFVPEGDYSLRVGYCPAVVEGGFIKAKTLLFPGQRSTPEYGKILSAHLPADQKREMFEEAEHLDAEGLLNPTRLDVELGPGEPIRLVNLDAGPSRGFQLLHWFHDQGVPQVRPGKVRFVNPTA